MTAANKDFFEALSMLEHELRYKSDRKFTQQDAARLRLCSDAISEIDREMQDIYQGNEPQYHA